MLRQRTTSLTLPRGLSRSEPVSFSAFDTVLGETPASAATSVIRTTAPRSIRTASSRRVSFRVFRHTGEECAGRSVIVPPTPVQSPVCTKFRPDL